MCSTTLVIRKTQQEQLGSVQRCSLTLTDDERRRQLRDFAGRSQLDQTKGSSPTLTKSEALGNIINKAADLAGESGAPADTMISDVEQVLIGENLRSGRGKGTYFVGNYNGASGFRPDLMDNYNQVQHAAAGLVIGYRYGLPGQIYAKWKEEEPVACSTTQPALWAEVSTIATIKGSGDELEMLLNQALE